MLKYFLLPVFFIAGLLGRAQDRLLMNDPNAVLRDIGKFNSVHVNGPFKVYFSEGKQSSLAISASSTEARDKINTYVSNGELHIELETSTLRWITKSHNFKIYISAPTLKTIHASGAVNFILVDILNGEDIKLKFTGASDMVGKIECDELNADFSGASDLELNGKAKSLVAKFSGASSMKSAAFLSNDADLHASGASTIKVGVSSAIKAVASGASTIIYYGSPSTKDNNASGASSIKKGN